MTTLMHTETVCRTVTFALSSQSSNSCRFDDRHFRRWHLTHFCVNFTLNSSPMAKYTHWAASWSLLVSEWHFFLVFDWILKLIFLLIPNSISIPNEFTTKSSILHPHRKLCHASKSTNQCYAVRVEHGACLRLLLNIRRIIPSQNFTTIFHHQFVLKYAVCHQFSSPMYWCYLFNFIHAASKTKKLDSKQTKSQH